MQDEKCGEYSHCMGNALVAAAAHQADSIAYLAMIAKGCSAA